MDWSAWTGNVIALAAIAYTWWTGRGTKQATAAARAQAAESLRAAQEAAAAQERMAEVMERIYEAQERHGIVIGGSPTAPGAHPSVAAAQAFPAAPWRVVNIYGGRYLLTNAGPGAAYDVRVTASSTVQFTPPTREPGSTWAPGDGEDFTATGSWHQGIPQLVVTWRETAGGDERRWERVIPK